MNVVADYVSVWDDCDEVRTSCVYNPITKRVSHIETADADEGYNTCTREYIELSDGTQIDTFYDEDRGIHVIEGQSQDEE